MKLQKISEITATLPFTEFNFLQKYRESFKSSELGCIHEQLRSWSWPRRYMPVYHIRNKYRLMAETLSLIKYKDGDKARPVYAKQRRPRKSETRKLLRRLLHLLEKLPREWNHLNRLTLGLLQDSNEVV